MPWAIVAAAYAVSAVSYAEKAKSVGSRGNKKPSNHLLKQPCSSCGSHEFHLHNGVQTCSYCRLPIS